MVQRGRKKPTYPQIAVAPAPTFGEPPPGGRTGGRRASRKRATQCEPAQPDSQGGRGRALAGARAAQADTRQPAASRKPLMACHEGRSGEAMAGREGRRRQGRESQGRKPLAWFRWARRSPAGGLPWRRWPRAICKPHDGRSGVAAQGTSWRRSGSRRGRDRSARRTASGDPAGVMGAWCTLGAIREVGEGGRASKHGRCLVQIARSGPQVQGWRGAGRQVHTSALLSLSAPPLHQRKRG